MNTDTPLEDPQKEAQAQYLIEHLIRPGQRLCCIRSENKKAWPINKLFDPADPYCRHLVRQHVLDAPENQVEFHLTEDKEKGKAERWFHFDVEQVRLGLYFGGTQTGIGSGIHQCSSYGIDADQSNYRESILAELDKSERDAFRKKKHGDDEIVTEIKRLDAMFAEAQRLFPHAAWFRKANGKFHGHANTDKPICAKTLKSWGELKLASSSLLQHIEFFPKTQADKPGDGYQVGNQMRLPFNPDCAYIPVGPLAPLLLHNTDEILVNLKSVPEVATVVSVPSSTLENEFSQDLYCGVDRSTRRTRYLRYLESEKYPPAIDGSKGSPRLLNACARRFDFGVPLDDAFEVLLEYNKRCVPPWSETEIRHKLNDARAQKKFPPGCKLKQSLPSESAPAPSVKFEKALPEFPIDVFPEDIRDFISAVAWSAQVPLDLPAQSVLAAIATATVKADIKCEWKPGTVEPSNIYALTVLPPSDHKTTALAPIMEPLHQIQAEAQREYDDALATHKSEVELLDNKIDTVKSRLKRKDTTASDADLRALLGQKHALKPPILNRILVNDITPEELNTVMAENGCASMLSSEAGIIDNIAPRYSKTNSPQQRPYLHFWSGEKSYIDRRGRREEAEGVLTLGICAPSKTLKEIVSKIENAREMGLLSRFLFSMPRSLVGGRAVDDVGVDKNLKIQWKDRLVKIFKHPTTMLTLSPEAREALRAWRSEIESRLLRDLLPIQDWSGKLQVGQVVRLASILHSVTDPTGGVVSLETMDNAIKLGRYYIDHAQAAFEDMMSGEEQEAIQKIMAFAEICENATFKNTELLRKYSWNNEKIEPVVKSMIDSGMLKDCGGKIYRLLVKRPALKPLAKPMPSSSAIQSEDASPRHSSIPSGIPEELDDEPAVAATSPIPFAAPAPVEQDKWVEVLDAFGDPELVLERPRRQMTKFELDAELAKL